MELERIHDEHIDAMFRHGKALLRNESAVQDLFQDVYLKLASGRAHPENPSAERCYLLSMIHHSAIDQMRTEIWSHWILRTHEDGNQADQRSDIQIRGSY